MSNTFLAYLAHEAENGVREPMFKSIGAWTWHRHQSENGSIYREGS